MGRVSMAGDVGHSEHGGEHANTPKGVCSPMFAEHRRTMFADVRCSRKCSLRNWIAGGDKLVPR